MSIQTEPELIQQQREILRALRQATDQHTQVVTPADEQWQNLQRKYDEVRELLAKAGEEQALANVPTAPPTAPPDVEPVTAFHQTLKRTTQVMESIKDLLQTTLTSWQPAAVWEARQINTVAFSPDGRLLASGGRDKTVNIWEVATGRLLHTRQHKNWVRSVAFSPDGRLLASGGNDKTVNIWEVATGRLLYTHQHKAEVQSVAFSPDGRLLASGGHDNAVRIWEVATGNLLHTLQQEGVDSVTFSPDGRLLASGGLKTVNIWEVATGNLLHTLRHKGIFPFVWCVAFSPDGRLLASGGWDKTVNIWEVATGRLLHTLQHKGNKVFSVAFSPDGRLLASGCLDETVNIWEMTTGRLFHTLQHKGMVRRVAFSPDGRLLAVGGDGEYIQLLRGAWPDLPARAAELARGMAEARYWYERLREQAASDYRRAFQERIVTAYRRWTESLTQSPGAFAWQAWQDRHREAPLAGDETRPKVLRLGEMRVPLLDGEPLTMPALLPFPLLRALLFTSSGQRPALVGAVQSLLLRLLAIVPPGKLRFTFIDPIGLGQNVAPFMSLADYDEALVTARAWSEPRHIEQRLAELTEHIETVIQKYLRHEYATIEEYNQHASEIAEPYRFLVVFDFPANFNEDAIRRLVSIVQNGPRCGVYAVILMDTARPQPYGFNPAELEQACTVISWQGSNFVWEDESFRGLALELDSPPEAELFDRIIRTVGEAAKEAGKVEVPFERIILPKEQWWQADSRSGIQVPLGPSGARRVQYLDLGQGTAQHALVAGKTGSGKSTLLHVLITSLALHYSPEEVELYLVDFKKGVEFKAYATYQLPHARVIAIESEREFGLSVLEGLDAELKRRGDLFRAAGVDHIADYRKKALTPSPLPTLGEGPGVRAMPRILLIVDEFQEFFSEDDPVAQKAAQLLDRLVRQGRAFGMHVLLGSQTLAGSYTLARSTIDQMAVRIALQCSEADSRLILADDNPAARLLSRPGEAIYNDANGLVEGNHPFQVAWLSDEERERYLRLIWERVQQPPRQQIVFEGNAPADVTGNPLLKEALLAAAPLAPRRRVDAWLGEPVAIAPPTAAHFRRQSASNLLIVGREDEVAAGMLAAALLSLAAQHAPTDGAGGARFYFLDFGAVDAPYADLWPQLAGIIPHPFQVGRRGRLAQIMGEIANEVNARLQDEVGAAQRLAIYLAIFGLQRARDLRAEEDLAFSSFSSFGESEPAAPGPGQQFQTIVREGPDLGVHTLTWCDSYTNLGRMLDHRLLREFEMRVVLQMSAEDSANLIDTPAASKLGPYRAFFYSEDEGRLEKFRPYGLPPSEWLAQLKEYMAARKG